MRQSTRKCRTCGHKTLHAQAEMVTGGVGLILTIITCGLFLPLWLLLAMCDAFQPRRCQQCGSRN